MYHYYRNSVRSLLKRVERDKFCTAFCKSTQALMKTPFRKSKLLDYYYFVVNGWYMHIGRVLLPAHHTPDLVQDPILDPGTALNLDDRNILRQLSNGQTDGGKCNSSELFHAMPTPFRGCRCA
jgi:hypothetical protein